MPKSTIPPILRVESLAQSIERAQEFCFDAQVAIHKAAARVAESRRLQSERQRWKAVWSRCAGSHPVVVCLLRPGPHTRRSVGRHSCEPERKHPQVSRRAAEPRLLCRLSSPTFPRYLIMCAMERLEVAYLALAEALSLAEKLDCAEHLTTIEGLARRREAEIDQVLKRRRSRRYLL